MIKEELYKKTVDILVQAYFNDTLQRNNCYACAVGNLVAANMGMIYVPSGERKFLKWANGEANWNNVHCKFDNQSTQKICPEEYFGVAKKQIDSTGYRLMETASIELAFESALKGKSDDEDMFNGLMSVIEVLDKIHKNTNTEITQQSKSKFNKQLNPIT